MGTITGSNALSIILIVRSIFFTWNDRRNDPAAKILQKCKMLTCWKTHYVGRKEFWMTFQFQPAQTVSPIAALPMIPRRMYLVVWNDYQDVIFDAQMLFPRIGTYGFNVLWDPGTIYAQWFDEEGNQ